MISYISYLFACIYCLFPLDWKQFEVRIFILFTTCDVSKHSNYVWTNEDRDLSSRIWGGVISIRLVGEKITDIVTIYSIILWELDD